MTRPERLRRLISARPILWTIGLIVIGLGASLADEGRRPLVWIVELLLFAAIAEIGAQVERLFRIKSVERAIPPGARPADGAVETVPIRGVYGEPNSVDPKFRRFVSIVEEDVSPFRENPESACLLGRATLISVFNGRDGRRWTAAEIADAHRSIERAGRWIEREAARWNAPVNLEVAETYFETIEDREDDVEIGFVSEPDGDAPMERHAATKALIEFSRASARLGFADAGDLTARIAARIDADIRIWLFHERRAGRSFALPGDESPLPGVAIAVCHAREANFPEPLKRPPFVDPVTLVHEILHLFGATDKYGVPLSKYPPKTVGPRDVMRLEFESLDRLKVDRLTAAEIGWTDWPR